jgi:hypothetical protein
MEFVGRDIRWLLFLHLVGYASARLFIIYGNVNDEGEVALLARVAKKSLYDTFFFLVPCDLIDIQVLSSKRMTSHRTGMMLLDILFNA